MELKQRITAVLLLLIICIIPLTGCGFDEPEIPYLPVMPPPPEPQAPRVYIALGDSVPAGFGVAYTERYTALLFEGLYERDYVDKYVNFAEDGFTTTLLLDLLNNMSEDELNLFQNAHLVTINIGGNDILTPLIDYLPTPDDVMDIIYELWEFVQETMEIIPEVMDIASGFQEALDNFSLWRVWELPALNRMVQDASPVLGDVTDMFDRVGDLQVVRMLPMLYGSFSPELDAALMRGVASFAVEFNDVIRWVNTHALDAVIIVNTVYNPIPNHAFGMSLEGISGRANTLIQSINRIILEGSVAEGYLVADIFTHFAYEPDNMMNFFIDASQLTLSFDIIHPSAVGHELIAGINYELFNSLPS
ncbi:MAG: SGNH/GDSL hydrolase family protein [Defluviitaleaceae bacterium]|nr:SGNH/GDSL hydrolase family protein [Defluviitaleaceae bacterium]